MDEEEVRVQVGTWFETHAKEVDEDVVDYVSGVVSTDEDLCESIRRGSLTELIETLGPILEDALGLEDDLNAETKIDALCSSFAKQVLAGPEEEKNNNIEVKGNEARKGGGGFVIADAVAFDAGEQRLKENVLSSEQLQAQYRVPTLPEQSAKERAKLERRRQREEENKHKELEHHRREVEKMLEEQHGGGDGAAAPAIVRNQGGPPVVDLNLDQVSVEVGGQELIEDCALTLARGRRYGLVGRNGTGKTSLLRLLCQPTEHTGIKGIPRNCQILHVAQEVRGEQTTVLESVLDCDVERKELLERERELLRRAEEGAPGHQSKPV